MLWAISLGRNHYLLIPWNQAIAVVAESSSLALFDATSTRIPGADDFSRLGPMTTTPVKE